VFAPFFVSTQYNSFDEYVMKLTKSSRWNYKNVRKKYESAVYCEVDRAVGKRLLPFFRELWKKQLIRGRPGSGSITSGPRTRFFVLSLDGAPAMLHLVEYHKNYAYCHMPMYDKILHPELSKLAWFSLIKHMIENTTMKGIDMGGSCGRVDKHKCGGHHCNPDFRFIIKNRKLMVKYEYKFLYLTKLEKDYKNVSRLVIRGATLEDLDETR